MMEIMGRLVMRNASNESANGTESLTVRKQVHRQYAIDLKRRIVEETFAPGASVSMVARRHDVNANLVFAWREKYRQGALVDKQVPQKMRLPGPDLIQIGAVDYDGAVHPLPVSRRASVSPEIQPRPPVPALSSGAPGMIEIELCSGIKVRVGADMDEATLRRVLSLIKDVA